MQIKDNKQPNGGKVEKMGTINYRTSDYITMGIKPVDGWDLLHDPEMKEELENEVAEYGGSIEEAAQSLADCYNESDYENAAAIFNKYDFTYYHITLNCGYYDGFYFDIENNYGIAYDNCEDKRQAQKEITQIKKMLLELAGVGVVACSPGWSTGYSDYAGTIQKINEAIKEMRNEAKGTPTDRYYSRLNGWS